MNQNISQIESSVAQLDMERAMLQQENLQLRTENKWYKEKIAQLEKHLVLTEQKHGHFKR